MPETSELSIHPVGLCGWKQTERKLLEEESVHGYRSAGCADGLYRRCHEPGPLNKKTTIYRKKEQNTGHIAKRPSAPVKRSGRP